MAGHKTFHLTIARVDGPLFDDVAISVTVPGIAGVMTVLAGHEPLISPLASGMITVTRADGSRESFDAEGGTMEVGAHGVSLLL